MKTMQFYIGDEPNDAECDVETFMSVRTMLESVDDVTQMHNMLLDSGADASVFPVSMAELGSPCNNVHTVLRDAQGQTIPLHGYRDVELHFMDMKGRSAVLRETVALSDRITQPILCFGHLLENGWSVNGIEQTLTHGSGISIPIELQNKSMLLRGWVRMIKDEFLNLSASGQFVQRFSMSFQRCVLAGTLVPKGLVQGNTMEVAFKIQHFHAPRCLEGVTGRP